MLQTKPDDRESVKMEAVQLPIIINNATTGHKLQGSGVDCLFVHSWNYVTNWPYVVLSRVKTKNGLYLRKKLSRVLDKYKVPKELTKMLSRLRQKAPSYWSSEEYAEYFS